MAKDKQSFILYCDILTTIEKLPNESAGKLFKHILNYVNDKTPELDDLLLEIAFEPIKQSLKRDLIKYEKAQETARLNGLKGGRPRNQTKPNKTQKTQSVISKPRKPVSVSVSVSDSVIVSEDQESSGFRLPPEINQLIWNEFEQHRKEIKKPLTDLARTKNANILKPLSHDDQKYIVDYSISARYTGLFPDQLNKRNNNETYQRSNTGSNRSLSAVDRVKRATGFNEQTTIDITPYGHIVD